MIQRNIWSFDVRE